MGAITPIGLDIDSTWESLLAGKSGIDRITAFDASEHETQIAGEVKGFDPLEYVDRKEARRMDRFVHLAIGAAKQAMEQSGLDLTPALADEVGCLIGAGIGGIGTLSSQVQVMTERGPGRVSPFLCTMMIPDIAAGQIAISLGLRGPNYCTVSACASGGTAIGEAYETIKRGDAIAMFAGGAEAAITPIAFAAFNAMKAISTRNDEPQKASRPFDRDRDGFVVSEGAGVILLESLDHALGRGANILAEVIGYGASADAWHVCAPPDGGVGAQLAMKRALRKANIQPDQIDYINAHATSTPMNDTSETAAIKAVLGEHAYHVPISGTKSMIGHIMGGGGAIEAAVCVKTLNEEMIHPTINLDNPDPTCDLDYVPHKARRATVRTILSNSFGFGGHNACLVLKRFEQ
jgi:3-oxoacyl-[acyl-carrier-protein] synthase II